MDFLPNILPAEKSDFRLVVACIFLKAAIKGQGTPSLSIFDVSHFGAPRSPHWCGVAAPGGEIVGKGVFWGWLTLDHCDDMDGSTAMEGGGALAAEGLYFL